MENSTANIFDDIVTFAPPSSDPLIMYTPTSDLLVTSTPFSDSLDLPVYGLPGYGFYLIHITGVFSLTCSIITSLMVLFYMNYPFKINLYTRSIGERLIVYLAGCDLFYSCSHMMDHAYMLAILNFPPETACRAFSFFLNEFILAQSLMVCFTALNAFLMVVMGKKLSLGPYDWKLMVVAFGFPLILSIIFEVFSLLGPSGPWCYIDLRRPIGKVINNVISFVFLFTFLLNLLCYFGVFMKMRSVQQKISGGHATASNESTKNHKVARIMMLFVFVYILQYWAFCVYAVNQVVAEPSIVVLWATVFFTNLGGVFNMLAYTLLRRRTVGAAAQSENTAAQPSMMTTKTVIVKTQEV